MNPLRNGSITSSEIIALTTSGKTAGSVGKPFYTYIEECNMERRLQRCLTKESNARPLSWGKLVERRAFDILGTEYKICSQETLIHPFMKYWLGSPDLEKFDKGKTVCDIKCPITLDSFCRLVDPYYENGKLIHKALTIEAVRAGHKDGNKYYWQLVSNSILTGAKFAELIVYVPYITELQSIREMASNVDELNTFKYMWINYAQDEELPFLNVDGFYKNVNIIRFEVPEEDKDFLTQRVLLGGSMLKDVTTIIKKPAPKERRKIKK